MENKLQEEIAVPFYQHQIFLLTVLKISKIFKNGISFNP